MGHDEPLSFSFNSDMDLDLRFADELLSQFDLKRQSLHQSLVSEPTTLDNNQDERHNDDQSESATDGQVDDAATPFPLDSPPTLPVPPNEPQTPSAQKQQPVRAATLSARQRRLRPQPNLLRRSSTYLRQRFLAAEPPPPPPPPPPLPTKAAIPPPPPSFSPMQYPPKPLCYSPVDPPSDVQRSSLPLFPTSWRRKSDPRRQSEPLIKPKRSFFFFS